MQLFLTLVDVRFKPIEGLVSSSLPAFVQQACLDVPVDSPCRDPETLCRLGLDERATLISLLLADLDYFDDEVVVDFTLSAPDTPEDISQHSLQLFQHRQFAFEDRAT